MWGISAVDAIDQLGHATLTEVYAPGINGQCDVHRQGVNLEAAEVALGNLAVIDRIDRIRLHGAHVIVHQDAAIDPRDARNGVMLSLVRTDRGRKVAEAAVPLQGVDE